VDRPPAAANLPRFGLADLEQVSENREIALRHSFPPNTALRQTGFRGDDPVLRSVSQTLNVVRPAPQKLLFFCQRHPERRFPALMILAGFLRWFSTLAERQMDFLPTN
jgi:hypothetical protein